MNVVQRLSAFRALVWPDLGLPPCHGSHVDSKNTVKIWLTPVRRKVHAYARGESVSLTSVIHMTHAGTEITAGLVRDLLRDQHPDLADRPLSLGARGWDNQLWRLGGDLAVRLPWATQTEGPRVFRTHEFAVILRGYLHFPVLVHRLLRGPVTDCGVKTLPIVVQLDVTRDVFPCFPACRVDRPVNPLDFQHAVE